MPPIRSTKAGRDRVRDAVSSSSYGLRGVPGKLGGFVVTFMDLRTPGDKWTSPS